MPLSHCDIAGEINNPDVASYLDYSARFVEMTDTEAEVFCRNGNHSQTYWFVVVTPTSENLYFPYHHNFAEIANYFATLGKIRWFRTPTEDSMRYDCPWRWSTADLP